MIKEVVFAYTNMETNENGLYIDHFETPAEVKQFIYECTISEMNMPSLRMVPIH